MTWKIYGIPNCDTVRKARQWLANADIQAEFVDYRSHPLQTDTVTAWVASLGMQQLLNRRSSTWRSLSSSQQSLDEAAMIRLLCESPTLIKRPVLCRDGQAVLCGFDESAWHDTIHPVDAH